MKKFIKNNWFKITLIALLIYFLYIFNSGVNVHVTNTIQVEYAEQNNSPLDFDF